MSAHDQRGSRRLRLVPVRPVPAEPIQPPEDLTESSVHPALEPGRAEQRLEAGRAEQRLEVDRAEQRLERPSDPTSTPVPASTSFPEKAWSAVAERAERAAPRAAALAELPDGQLVALAATGETRAFETLYRRHVAFALHLATRIEGSSRDVEDVVHDAFLRAFERLADLADRNAFRAWLGAIVVHAVRSRLRRTRLMNLLGLGRASEPVDLDALASPDCSPHVRAQIAQVYALLRTLPTDDRIAWTLRAVEGHDLETVARLSSCSLATVKRRISRAQKFLDDHFIHTDSSEGSRSPGQVES